MYNDRNFEDFYVGVQPMLRDVRFSDLSWVSKFDCFHPSLLANQIISVSAFNSMQLPPNRKPTNSSVGVQPICPTESTFLQ